MYFNLGHSTEYIQVQGPV